MLQIKDITKVYEIGKKKSKDFQSVQALNGVNLEFRKSEFVSILGPSGCGKTTLLNIIGGLDKYTSGDLVINGKSTKQFKDKDWDNYRNHSVGFVFQSYNLIQHQTILQNVELALTLSGVKRDERKRRALEALDKVGLKDRANNLPNQLSGGQMQRVAIARAIVNDPDIILADEPTGALDSKTSVQILNILKEISNDKLVIMVTHNPELAQEYSTRIIKLKDGEVLDDSNPYNSTDEKKSVKNKKTSAENVENDQTKTKPKKRMSFFTALSLSFKNLLTKKARTLLVSFAGSIGIIGIALILAVASGFNGYINQVQEDTLSSYPIVIEEQSQDYTKLLSSMLGSSEQSSHELDAVYSNETLSSMLGAFSGSMKHNDMKAFNAYLQEHYDELEPYVTAIKYTYNLNLNAYDGEDTEYTSKVSPNSDVMYDLIIQYFLVYLKDITKIGVDFDTFRIYKTEYTNMEFYEQLKIGSAGIANIYNGLTLNNEYYTNPNELADIIMFIFKDLFREADLNSYKNPQNAISLFSEMIDNRKFLQSQYDVIYGSWNNEQVYIDSETGKPCVETMLVLNDKNELDDYMLYAMGFIDNNGMGTMFEKILSKEKYSAKIDYDKILNQTYKIFLDDAYYTKVDEETFIKNNTPSGDYILVKISGILRVNKNTNGGALDTGLVYPKALTDYCINKFNNSEVVTSGNLPEIDKSKPNKIAIYANSFEVKEVIEDFIAKYNSTVDEDHKITYTDYMALMMSAVNSIVNTVTYVLIAFVSVSLIVSSIMIGIITYISVLERTKEIGVLRSIGASKRDIKRVFTAESLIIGFTAGVLGILITLLLCIPINLIFKSFTGLSTLAMLPVSGGIILVGISMLLTFIAGLMPANVASKKDPVIALRSE